MFSCHYKSLSASYPRRRPIIAGGNDDERVASLSRPGETVRFEGEEYRLSDSLPSQVPTTDSSQP